MPELAPSIEEVIELKQEQGIQLNYEQTMAMLRADDRVAFVDDESRDWSTEFLSDDEWTEV